MPNQIFVAFWLISPLALPLLSGCSETKPAALSSQNRSDSVASSDCQDDVDNVARCFHESVTVLQREPENLEAFAVFIKEAEDAIIESGQELADAKFEKLQWGSDGTFLIASNGQPIQCRITEQTHDNFGPQGTSWLTEYEFYIPDSDCQSRTTIELSMGH